MAERGPEDGAAASEPAAPVNSANMHFFRPNDNISVSEGPEHRTLCVSPALPSAMARADWHVEQFELHKELYRGKTSLLYMATDRQSGMQVALKLYRKRKLSVLNRYQVEREVRLHINLQHENIIHLFAAFEDEKHVYMVQEFAVCGDLFEDLKKGGGQLKEKYAVRDVVVPFLSALGYLHAQGIIHRDIKPENILLGANKTVKIADFGLSININHERPVTRAGTLDYMAPEVLVCPDKRRPEENKDKVLLGYTAQVDSWAVGILAYELLVGYPPFEQESRAATYEHIMYKEPKFPAWMTEDAKRFISLALHKNATQRPTVYDLMQHPWVLPYIGRPGGAASSAAGSTSAPSAPGPSRLRNSVSVLNEDAREAAMAAAAVRHTSASISGLAPSASSPSPSPAAFTAAALSAAAAARGSMPLGAMMLQPHPHAHSADVAGGGGGHRGMLLASNPHAISADSALAAKHSPQAPAALHRSPQGTTGGAGPDGGRLYDAVSDPSARSCEGGVGRPGGGPQLQTGVSPVGASRSGGGAPDGLERAASISNSGGVRAAPALQSANSGSLGSRLGPLSSPHGRPTPPPLTLEAGLEAHASSTEYSPSGLSCGGGLEPLVISPGAAVVPPPAQSRDGGHPRGSSALGSRPALQPLPPAAAGGAAAAPGTPPPQRHRMGSQVPPLSVAVGGPAGGPGRLPASALSPKPHTPDTGPGYHRPASGVLSDDSILPPVRSPSISLGAGQYLSPLQQAALLAGRPSSRLNSPSHSRRNSVSTAGQAPSAHGGVAPAGVSMPLPVLAPDSYGDFGSYGLDHDRTSSSQHKVPPQAHGGGGGGGGASKLFSKFWGGGGGAGSGTDSPMEMPGSSGPSFTSRGGGANASPMARSAAAARARMMTAEDLRPLMRESSMTSSLSARGGLGGLREELAQPSMTQYMRPGKVPGVGRAAVAAREAEAAEAAAASGMGGGSGGLHKHKSLVNRNLHGVVGEDGGPALARMGSEVALARTAAGAAAAAASGGGGGGGSGPPGVSSQRSFTSANSAFARKLANGAIATKVTEYVRGRMPHDEEMDDC